MKATDVKNVQDWVTYQSEQLNAANEQILKLNQTIYKLMCENLRLKEKLNGTSGAYPYDN